MLRVKFSSANINNELSNYFDNNKIQYAQNKTLNNNFMAYNNTFSNNFNNIGTNGVTELKYQTMNNFYKVDNQQSPDEYIESLKKKLECPKSYLFDSNNKVKNDFNTYVNKEKELIKKSNLDNNYLKDKQISNSLKTATKNKNNNLINKNNVSLTKDSTNNYCNNNNNSIQKEITHNIKKYNELSNIKIGDDYNIKLDTIYPQNNILKDNLVENSNILDNKTNKITYTNNDRKKDIIEDIESIKEYNLNKSNSNNFNKSNLQNKDNNNLDKDKNEDDDEIRKQKFLDDEFDF